MKMTKKQRQKATQEVLARIKKAEEEQALPFKLKDVEWFGWNKRKDGSVSNVEVFVDRRFQTLATKVKLEELSHPL